VIPSLEVSREFARALFELCLAIPRQIRAFGRRKARLKLFEQLRHDPIPTQIPPLEPTPDPSPKTLLLSCGDASGESHAVRLIEELRAGQPNLQIQGFGGARLAALGMDVWQPLADFNVMGFKDVLAQLPLFIRCVHRFAAEIRHNRPDAVVLIDYPGLNRHLLRIAHRAGVPVIDYIAPQLWAWAPWRITDFRKADQLLTILPFESDWYQRHGATAQYVGHPLGDGLHRLADSEADPPAQWAPESHTWVGILPGSRRREIEENLPTLLRAAAELQKRQPQVRFVLPHLRSKVDRQIRLHLAQSKVEVLYAPGCFHRILPGLQAAWVASGTALLEVAAHRVPPVLVYAISSRLGAWLSRHWLAVPWIGSLNLLANRELAPEHLGRHIDPIALADDLEARLAGPTRDATLAAIEELWPAFAEPGAARRAAQAVNMNLNP
jgi:lipid-A-disaccharide synthase